MTVSELHNGSQFEDDGVNVPGKVRQRPRNRVVVLTLAEWERLRGRFLERSNEKAPRKGSSADQAAESRSRSCTAQAARARRYETAIC